MPLAIQYGMSEYQFWHGDMRLLEVYQKAYYREKSYSAWLIGARVFEANSKISANENRQRKSDKVEIDYIQRKHVKKANSGKPGFVIYHTNYSMMIEPDISNIKQE